MIKSHYLVFLAFFAFFVGCSEKQYFTPQTLNGEVEINEKLSDDIVQSNRNGAKLANGAVITKDGIFDVKLDKNTIFLNTSGNLLLVAHYDNNTISLLNTDGKELDSFGFEYMPLSASLRDGILAVVLSNNTMILWDTKANEEVFNLKSSAVYAIDSKSASPVFSDDVVVFPTFDGKIVFVNLNSRKVINSLALGSGEFFNNIIYLSVGESLKKSIVVANRNKLMTIINGKDFSRDLEIVDILHLGDRIFALSLEGEIIEFDLLLNEINKKKFPFASLGGIIVDDFIYTLESQGYLIKIDPQTFVESIYEIDIGEYKNNFYTKDVIYYDDKIIKFPK